jgi:hypothetical protein
MSSGTVTTSLSLCVYVRVRDEQHRPQEETLSSKGLTYRAIREFCYTGDVEEVTGDIAVDLLAASSAYALPRYLTSLLSFVSLQC